MTVDLSRSIEEALRKALHRAEELSRDGRAAEAAAVYREAARLVRQLAQYAISPAEKARRIERAMELERLAERVADQKGPAGSPRQKAEKPAPPRDELQAQIEALISRADVSWDEIGGLDQTKQQLQLAFGIAVAQKPPGIKFDVIRNVLLYGPPGTGKSLLAAAVSRGLQATFFNVTASGILSKWFGESSRLISALFSTARQRAPSVVFLDELESLFRSRDAAPSGAEHQVLATLLAEISGMATSSDARPVFVIGATNAPWLMDPAALSRFGRRIYVPLPDAAARRAVLEIHLTRKGHRLDFPVERLVEATVGLSGRQIAYLAAAAVEAMVAQSNPDLAEVVAKGCAGEYPIKTRALKWEDFEPLLAKTKPDTSLEELRRFENW
jgi:SpoVK/Ycf46/Vps4 family AAA+-type ATPase